MITVGIDEVGRGCWAGPVVAGAVILPPDFAADRLIGWKLADSKLLSKQQREVSDARLRQIALSIGLGWIDAATIDRVGISTAVKWAMEQAVAQINAPYDEIIIDGNINFLPSNSRARAVVKADASVPAVSAASIIAKVARDNYMSEMAVIWPGYGFERHVGYGTVLHHEQLKLQGVSQLHRRSFKPIQALLP